MFSCIQLFVTPYSQWNSLGQNTGVGSLSLLQGIFPTQRLNPGLMHSRLILYQLSHKGSPDIDCSMQTVYFIYAALLFCNWNFVPLNIPHIFPYFLHFPLLSLNISLSSISFYFVILVHIFCFLEFTYK